MKISNYWSLMLLALAVVIVGWQGSLRSAPDGQPPGRVRWEYQIYQRGIHAGKEAHATDLDKLGAEGWELVAMTESDTNLRCVFKRAK